jgi:glutaredoxin 3
MLGISISSRQNATLSFWGKSFKYGFLDGGEIVGCQNRAYSFIVEVRIGSVFKLTCVIFAIGDSMDVKVYSTPTCPYCNMAKSFLKENNVTFTNVDVAADHKAAKEMVEKTGQMGVPVIEVNGKFIVGFDKDAIKKELGL